MEEACECSQVCAAMHARVQVTVLVAAQQDARSEQGEREEGGSGRLLLLW